VFPTVTVGDTVAVPFAVSNGGLQPLDVLSFQAPTSELEVSSPPPHHLIWTATLGESLRLAATTPGNRQDSLVIVSNDPLFPRRRVNLRLDVKGLEFDTRVLGDPDSVSPGVSFIVVVTPGPGVRIE